MIATVALLLIQTASADELAAKALDLARERRSSEAVKLWRQALALSPDHFAALFNLGFHLQSEGRFPEAEAPLTRAVKIRPDDFNARYILGVTLSQLGRREDALRQWSAAADIRPAHVKLMQIMAIEYGKGRYFREAARIAERALAIDQRNENLWLIAIKSHQDAADRVAALRLAEKMLTIFPNSARAMFEYGYELHRAGRSAEAEKHLTRASETDPVYEEPLYFLGDLMMKRGDAAGAVIPLRRAVELQPQYTAARILLARALMAAAKYDEAEKELRSAIAADPAHPQPHLVLSQLLFRKGDEKGASHARDLSRELRKKNPEQVESPQGRPFPK